MLRVAPLVIWLLLVATACSAAPTGSQRPSPAPGSGRIYVLSASAPNVTVIDPLTRKVVQTADIPQFTSFTSNDDNNYSDGKTWWLGLRNVDKNDAARLDDAEVVALDLDTLTVAKRIALGKDKLNLFIGKLSRKGILYVTKMASAQVVGIDPQSGQIVSTWDVPVNGGVACDADVDTPGDGVERFYYPTREGNTLVALDTRSGTALTTVPFAKGITPWMLTSAPDHKTVWVMEDGSDSNSVVDAATLELIKRFPTGKGPYAASFSPDGKYAFIGHRREGVVSVIDAHTYVEVQRLSLGTYPRQVAVDAASRYAYVLLTQEHTIVVIELGTWKTIDRIDIGSANPEAVFVRR